TVSSVASLIVERDLPGAEVRGEQPAIQPAPRCPPSPPLVDVGGWALRAAGRATLNDE
ncbi:MAG: hypothetical protein JWM38_619, partial [Sphingomonas bacterium]|nr:hypothetical protein [Sphingomonas bacterium]